MRGNIKILLIADSIQLRSSTQKILTDSDCEVLIAESSSDAILALKLSKPDLLFWGISMRNSNSYSAYLALQNDFGAHIPIIIITSLLDLNAPGKIENTLNENYITYPFSAKALLDKINNTLSKGKSAKLTVPTNNFKSRKLRSITSLKDLLYYFRTEAEEIDIVKNKPIYKEQKHANYVYLVESGLVKIHRMDEYGKQLITGLYKPNEFFGFYSFKEISSYPETATCLTTSKLLRISNSKFQELLSQSSNLSLELAQLLSDKLSQLKNHLLEMAYGSVLKKTSNTILQFAENIENKPHQSIKICRNDLANVAGISTESLIRSLSFLKKERLIDINGRDIKILNYHKLQLVR